MEFKIGGMKSKSIISGIFITGLAYFIIIALSIFSNALLVPGTPGVSIVVKLYQLIYTIRTIGVPILGLILLKLICEALYKIVNACEIIIEKYNK